MTRRQATMIVFAVLGILYIYLLVQNYNKKVLPPISYPEEIMLVKTGDILVCEAVNDSIHLGFANHATNPMEAEYIINLVDVDKTTIYSVDDDTTYICHPNEIQKTIDANKL